MLFEYIKVWVLRLLSLCLTLNGLISPMDWPCYSDRILLREVCHLLVLVRCIDLSAVYRLETNYRIVLFLFLWLLCEMALDLIFLSGDVHNHLALMILIVNAHTRWPSMSSWLYILVVSTVFFVLLMLLLEHSLSHSTSALVVNMVILLDSILASHSHGD